MEPIFTLPYSEYAVANRLNFIFKKKEFSILIPLSRQEKGYDLIILNKKNNKTARIQVKSSRLFIKLKKSKEGYQYGMNFNNFNGKYKKGDADFYLFFCSFANHEQNKTRITRRNSWIDLILCYPEKDMFSFLKRLKTNRYFSYGFENLKEIFITRGLDKGKRADEYLLEYQEDKIRKHLK